MSRETNIPFVKLVASGNDFVLIDNRNQRIGDRKLRGLAKDMCCRRYGAGADGLLVIDSSKRAAMKMRIFNPDGSEAKMCGNGARSAMLWVTRTTLAPGHKGRCLTIETRAGILDGEIRGEGNAAIVKIKMPDPCGARLNIPVRVMGRTLHVQGINTGVPHAVVFVEGLPKIDAVVLGRAIRYHKKFMPGGANVDFVEILGAAHIRVRTYERGVENETLACGTGAVASAVLSSLSGGLAGQGKHSVKVETRGGEVLRVYFNRKGSRIDDVWLEGRAQIVYRGDYYV